MPALRSLAMLMLVSVLMQPAAAARPDHVTYVLGGVMSGPLRWEADLVTGEFSEAEPPPGNLGDRAGLDASTMPVTKRWTVPPERLAVLRRLAARAWRHGVAWVSVTTVHRGANNIPNIELIFCQSSIDALGRLVLEQGGRKRTFDFSTSCLTKKGEAFLTALFAAK